MKLALRTMPASNATWMELAAHHTIKTRLVTRYPHGGIVIGGVLYHSTLKRGVHKTRDWDPSRWELREFGGSDAVAALRFSEREGHGYDLLGLLPFIGIPWEDRDRDFCFELVYYMRTGQRPPKLVTAEVLLALVSPPTIA